jgi:hypothetical protein
VSFREIKFVKNLLVEKTGCFLCGVYEILVGERKTISYKFFQKTEVKETLFNLGG